MARTHIADMHFERSPYNAATAIVDARSGLVRCTPPRTKVALIAASIGREFAPYDDPDWEVWALNAVPSVDRLGRLRADRWFEMHVRSAQSEADMRWITRCPVPIYLPPHWAERVINQADTLPESERVPNAVRYPLEAVESNFAGYFTCTFAYQLALALLEGFTHIGLYGVELAYGTMRERSVEWACVSWWLGYAEAKGVTIELPPSSRLGRSRYRYGIEYDAEKRDVERYCALMVEVDKRRAAEGIGG